MSTRQDDLPIPGSLLLLELDDTHSNAYSGPGEVKQIVLSPKPSQDINDPLNWSWKRKQVAHLMLQICKSREHMRQDLS